MTSRLVPVVILFSAVHAVPFLVAAATGIAPSEARNHVGKTAMVCGKVASARYLETSARRPTFLNFGQPYPNHAFTALIWGTDRAKFGKPEEEYLEKNVCVTGEIEDYQGKPQMILSDPKQIRLEPK